MCFIVPHAWDTVKQMQHILYLEFEALEIRPDLHYITFMNEKILLNLSVLRKFIFLCYTQDYNEKYIFHFTLPHPPLLQREHLFRSCIFTVRDLRFSRWCGEDDDVLLLGFGAMRTCR
jgi:hypothetical protein